MITDKVTSYLQQKYSSLNNVLNNVFNNLFNKVFNNITETLVALTINDTFSLSFFFEQQQYIHSGKYLMLTTLMMEGTK